MSKALIGHTGFVGSNLSTQGTFDHFYNSKNFREMSGKKFEIVFCAGISAVKWWANKHPEEDWANIKVLLDVLRTIEAKHFVLLSTVDVFEACQGVNERSPITIDTLHPYGTHRYKVEEFVRQQFESTTIVRLPGLFGDGLKKNIIFDLMNDNEVEKIHSEHVFQFYSLENVYQDIVTTVDAGLELVHFATEPVSVREVARKAFNIEFSNIVDCTPARYDMQTLYAEVFGKRGHYIQSSDEILSDIKMFVARNRR